MLKRIKQIYNNNKAVIIMAIILSLYVYAKLGNAFVPLEKLTLPSALGYDIQEEDGKIEYKVPMSIYIYPGQEIDSLVISGTGDTLPRTRGTRQLQSPGKFLIGLEKIIVTSEKAARFGMENWLDILWANRTVNDIGYMVVSKESAEDIIKFKVEGYPSSGDYLHNVVEHLNDFNFYSRNYKLIDVFIRANTEGRSVILPYVEIKNGKLQVTGLALFRKDKMVRNIDSDEARALNLLREDGVSGIIQIVKGSEKYLSFSGKSNKSVKCTRVNDKYIFNIKLELKGEVVSNLLYKNLVTNPELTKSIEKELGKETEKVCYNFIKRMQNIYKVDCLELGRCAVEKYGRRKNIDWDEVVSNAQINVSAKVTITEIGRGDY